MATLVVVSIVPLALSAVRLVSINREALETAEKQYLTRSAVTLSDGIESYLRRMLEVELFPELWHLRTTL